MKSEDIIVKNKNGLHLRVAAEIVEIAKKHNSKVCISCEDCPDADGCSVMQLLLLGASCGKKVRVSVDGPDEDKTAAEISKVFNDGEGI